MKPYFVVSSFGALKNKDKTPVAVVVLTSAKIANLASSQMSMLGTTLQAVAAKHELPFTINPPPPRPNQQTPDEILRLSIFYLKHSWHVFEVFEIAEEEALLDFARTLSVEDHALKVIEGFKE